MLDAEPVKGLIAMKTSGWGERGVCAVGLVCAVALGLGRLAWARDEPPLSPDPSVRAARLVDLLGDEEFAARERAMSELIEIGWPAKAALRQGRQHADREIRYRCERILSMIDELDFHRRLTAFAAGRDDQHGLPGWDRYRDAFGNDGEARALFVEMQKAEPEIMRAIEDGQGVAKAIEVRCAHLQQLQRATRQPVSLGSLAAMLFAIGDQEVELGMEAGSALGSFCYQSELQNAMNDPAKRRILGRLLGQWIKRGDGWTAYQALTLAMRFDLQEGLIPAQKVLENPADQPYIRQNGILAIAKLGDERHVPLLEALLDDDSRCASQRVNDATYETQIRDVALAALLIMKQQDPEEFGFDRMIRNEMNVFITNTVGFQDDQQREAALAKWKDFREQQADLDAGP
jgi:hypothetical protein